MLGNGIQFIPCNAFNGWQEYDYRSQYRANSVPPSNLNVKSAAIIGENAKYNVCTSRLFCIQSMVEFIRIHDWRDAIILDILM